MQRRFAFFEEDLTTHSLVVGITGSGKTGLVMVLVEEVLRANIPVVMIDVKGDLPNLLLMFPELAPSESAPNPPTKRPLVSLMKQARGFGVGVVLGTQNPMDLDYRGLSNAGLWFVGRLQTDADRERVVDAMASEGGLEEGDAASLADTIKVLTPRWFVMKSLRRPPHLALLKSRTTLCWLRGPLTRGDLRLLVERD